MKIIETKMVEALIKTDNEGYGFHGTIAESPEIQAEIAKRYDLAAKEIMKLGLSQEQAVEFLDSRLGRHLGDEIFHRLVKPTSVAQVLAGWAKSHSMAKDLTDYGFDVRRLAAGTTRG